MTTRNSIEFTDDTDEATKAMDDVAAGRGWCNLTPEVHAEDVEVLSPSVFALRTRRGAPVASLVTSPLRRGVPQPSTLGVLHTRGRLGKELIAELLEGVPLPLRQDHQQRGLLFEVPAELPSATVLATMCHLLERLCDYERSGRWRLEVYERTARKQIEPR